MKKCIALFLVAALFSCSQKIANYKVTPNGYWIWRYSKPNEIRKDILSNGDTLCSDNIGWSLFQISTKKDTTWLLCPVTDNK